MTNPHLRYVEPPIGDPVVFRRALNAQDWSAAKDELLGLALHHDDWRWVQETCLGLLDHESIDLRTVAVISLGHVARIHRRLDQKAIDALKERTADLEVGGLAEEILEEVAIYLRR